MNQNNKTTTILLSGGGTAGHITPLLAVAKAYLDINSHVELHYIGQKGDKNISVIEESHLPIKIHLIHAGKYRRYHGESFFTRVTDVKTNALNIRDAFKFLVGIFQAKRVVKQIRPDAAFLKGGFVVVPVGKACASYGIPYITHDSDPLPGLANRLISKNAYAHAVAVEGVTAYPKEKLRITGIPLSDSYISLKHGDRVAARKRLGLLNDELIIFVFAGTQGARVIDEAMDASVSHLIERISNVRIIHVFGRLNQKMKDICYSRLHTDQRSRIITLDFVSNAYDYITAADIIIGRAGATTLAEIAMIGRAAIIIPAGQLTGGHQVENAKIYGKNGGIKIVNENELKAELADTIIELANDSNKRHAMEELVRQMAHPDAAEKIARLLQEASQKRVSQ